ncbi:hypothetical protein DY000_02022374 [Brassica cretica]|uniref:Xylanase inhibitor N-terminal domain-containing protein n=1 Tax=Brassica cretica TaxID=69181 RepID=A0ABQ7EG71_BRACR|nr:hypothetical protein DY000_02022374 [Brassica cretica]
MMNYLKPFKEGSSPRTYPTTCRAGQASSSKPSPSCHAYEAGRSMSYLKDQMRASSLPPESGFLPLGPGSLPPGSGPCLWVPGPVPESGTFLRLPGQTSITRAHQFYSRQGKILHIEDLLLGQAYERLIPAVTIDKGKIYAPCSTSTTLHTGPGHNLQHTDRDTPCSSKHIEAPCSLQHIDYSTTCSGHVPHRTDDSYHLQGHVPIQRPILELGPSIADPDNPAIFTTDRRFLPNNRPFLLLLRH